jgi:DNA-binding winged helix-turn-helix (wHTH) protein
MRTSDYHLQRDDERPVNRSDTGEEIRFGHFCAVPGARCLYANGQPIEIGSRAFDLLILLLHRRGTVVSKTEIMAQVWPSTTVDESNLRFQMATLRRALGAGREMIKTIPGRGYLLVTPQARPLERGDPTRRGKVSLPGPGRDVHTADRQGDGETLKSLFKLLGLEISTLSSVKDAVMKLARDAPVGIVLDLRLLDQACMDMLVQLARCDKRLSIILVSDQPEAPISCEAVSRNSGCLGSVRSPSPTAPFPEACNAPFVGEPA